ncbi:MAG TPA: DUF2182 domain-containing protein [Thermoplasmata archaeon]|jgi:predicted metal-binding membrane protein|nr:DUF2182 domain-containing protein [Thermoplasmata archaeon]
MADAFARTAGNPLRALTLPMAALVTAVVAASWFVTWSTASLSNELLMVPASTTEVARLTIFFLLMIVMMVAMMLPSALPMILSYRGLTRLENGIPSKPADDLGTVLFVAPYFLVWGAFGVLALFGLVVAGAMGSMVGPAAYLPAAVLIAAGAWQFTRTKEVCVTHCQSPMGFVMHHWRAGRGGAVRMGLRHSVYCVGCCWLFMIVLFVAGAMSLLWMGALAVVIFVEKVEARRMLASRVIGVLLVALGAFVAVRTYLGA